MSLLAAAADVLDPPIPSFWQPFPKQAAAVTLSERCFELLFGGAAGPGKSHALRGIACDYAARYAGAHIGLVRRTLPQLKQTHGLRLPEMLGDAARENRAESTWTFPNGSVIRFISLQHVGDEQAYKSAEFDVLLFDELTEFAEVQYTFMLSRVRSARGNPTRVVATSNPEGVGFKWVKRRFVSPRPEDLGPGQERPEQGRPWRAPILDNGKIVGWQPPRAYLAATLRDNPALLVSNPGYENQLNSLPDVRLRRALVDGDWDAMDAVPGALWSQATIDTNRVASIPVPTARVVTGVDPSGTNTNGQSECGIVAAALGSNRHVYVIHDASGCMTPAAWATATARTHNSNAGDRVVAERNFGGDMVEETLRHAEPLLPVRMVTASRGKALRAEPVAALYQRGLIHHVGNFPDLEDQMTGWTPLSGWSPDRLDALVWAVTDLLGGSAAINFLMQLAPPCPHCRTLCKPGDVVCPACGEELPEMPQLVGEPAPAPPAAEAPEVGGVEPLSGHPLTPTPVEAVPVDAPPPAPSTFLADLTGRHT